MMTRSNTETTIVPITQRQNSIFGLMASTAGATRSSVEAVSASLIKIGSEDGSKTINLGGVLCEKKSSSITIFALMHL